MFHIGQKIVCISDFREIAASFWAQELCIEFPVKDGIYTVRRLVQRQCGAGETGYGVMLDEILNMKNLLDKLGQGGWMAPDDPRVMQQPDEVAFDSRDFRPLITVEQFATTDQKVDS